MLLGVRVQSDRFAPGFESSYDKGCDIWWFPKIRDALLGVPILRTIIYSGYIGVYIGVP